MCPDDAPERINIEREVADDGPAADRRVDETGVGIEQQHPAEGRRDARHDARDPDADRQRDDLECHAHADAVPQRAPDAGLAEGVAPCLQAVNRRLGDRRGVEAVDEDENERVDDVKAHDADEQRHEDHPAVERAAPRAQPGADGGNARPRHRARRLLCSGYFHSALTCFRGNPLAAARVMLAHAAYRAGLAHGLLEVAVNLRILVVIIDLRAALLYIGVGRAVAVGKPHEAIAPAAPAKRQVTCRHRAGVEVLVEPLVRRHDDAPLPPVNAPHILSLGPEDRVALSAEDDDVRARAVAVTLLVSADREFGDVAAHRLAGEVELHVRAAGAALAVIPQRRGMRVGDEVGGHEEAAKDLAFAAEIIVDLGIEAVGELVVVVEDEIEIVEQVHHETAVRYGEVARGLAAAAVEVLVARVERNCEDAARPPLEGVFLALFLPDSGRAVPFDDVDHLLVKMLLRLQFAARWDLANVAVVDAAGAVEHDEGAQSTLQIPRLDRDGL